MASSSSAAASGESSSVVLHTMEVAHPKASLYKSLGDDNNDVEMTVYEPVKAQMPLWLSTIYKVGTALYVTRGRTAYNLFSKFIEFRVGIPVTLKTSIHTKTSLPSVRLSPRRSALMQPRMKQLSLLTNANDTIRIRCLRVLMTRYLSS